LYICGGPLATIFPKIFAKNFDIVFKGEMDDTFSDFVSKYFNSNLEKEQFIKTVDLSNFSGIYIEKDMILYENKAIHLTEAQFKSLPLPDREGFDHQNYQKFWQEREGIKATNIIVTVGCPYHCDFCSKPIFGDNLRKRNIKDIIYEIEIVKSMGYNYFWISDDCFTLSVKYLEEFCDELIAKNLNMNWCCLSRADMVDLGVLKKMKRSGCDKVYLGLESGSNEILKIMKKNTTVEKGKNGVELIKKAGIKVAGFFIVGYPEESWETIDQTFKYALELDLDEVSFNVPYPLPGTALFERISTIDMTKDWTIENEIKFVFKSIFDENRIKEKIDSFYKRYHRKKNTKSILSYE
jgi:anaerobic magnesium-protoporphyrin IX monomethyl ester cyclase